MLKIQIANCNLDFLISTFTSSSKSFIVLSLYINKKEIYNF